MALFGMRGKLDGALFRDSILRFSLAQDGPLPYHCFSQGDILLLSRNQPGWGNFLETFNY